MASSSNSSSDTSDNELDDDTKRSVKHLADLLLHKLKTNGMIAQLRSSPKKEQAQKKTTVQSPDSNKATKIRSLYEISSTNVSEKSEFKLTSRVMPANRLDYHRKKAEQALKKCLPDPVVDKEPQRHRESRKERKMKKKGERSSWASKGWASMKPKENPTDEEKMDLMLLKMRSTIDPKRHYKHTDVKMPKYFQVGKIIDSSADYHHRLPNKKRKRTMVEELLADAEFRKQNKKKYLEVVETKRKRSANYHGRAPRAIKTKKKSRK